jgi:site-specific recombinase XerD
MIKKDPEGLPYLLRDYINYNTNLNKSPNTIKEYKYDLTRFLKFMVALSNGIKPESIDFSKIDISNISSDFISRIDSSDIYEYMSFLATNLEVGPATRARKLAAIKGFFKYLTTKANVIHNNPAKDIETPKINKRLPKYLSITESQKLLEKAKEDNKNQLSRLKDPDKELTEHQKYLGIRDHAMVTLFLNCGMRLSELVGINLEHIKFDEAILTVIGKGNKERTVYLNKACMNVINEYMNVRPNITGTDSTALFLSDRKKRISNRMVQTAISEYLEAAGLKGYSTHKLRHTAATLMYQNGVDVRALQEILGHENIGTTEIYTHVDNYQIRQAMENNPLANLK